MFYALAARAMRSVLVDYARRRAAIKRAAGSTTQHEFFEEVVGRFEEEMQVDVLALDEALKTLQSRSKRQHDVVVMRFFGGFRVGRNCRSTWCQQFNSREGLGLFQSMVTEGAIVEETSTDVRESMGPRCEDL